MIQWLDDVGQDDRDRVGVKAAGQGELMATETDVPRGFVVGPAFFRSYLQHHGIEGQVDQLLHRIEDDDARQQLRDLIEQHELPDELQERIGKHYDEINLSKGVRNAGSRALELIGGQREQDFVAVRASASTPETGCQPELCVNGKTSVGQAVRRLWQRFYSPASVAVRDEPGTRPAVIVQRMIEPEVSGTIYTRHPVTGDDELLVESIYGIGTPLYEGEADPDRHRIDRGSGALEERSVAEKQWKKVQDPSTGGIVRRRVASDEQDTNSLDEQELRSLADDALEIEDRFTEPVRVDFAVVRNGLQVLDVKPLPDHRPAETTDGQDDVLTGLGLSNGSASGRLGTGHTEDGIAVLEDQSRERLGRLGQLRGWVTPRSSISTNLAAASRRKGVPAVGGIEPDTELHGQTVRIDGWRGTVTRQQQGQDGAVGERSQRTADAARGRRTPMMETGASATATPQGPDPGGHDTASPPRTATRLYALGSVTDGTDGHIVRSDSGFGWDSAPVLHRDEQQHPMQLIDSYADAFDDIDGLPLIHLGALISEGSQEQALAAVRHCCEDDRDCVVLLDRIEDGMLEELVRSGVTGVASDRPDELGDRLERVERRVLFEMLRERR